MYKCLHAYTPPSGNYPPYFNASLKDGTEVVRLIIRGEDGAHASMDMPLSEAQKIFKGLD